MTRRRTLAVLCAAAAMLVSPVATGRAWADERSDLVEASQQKREEISQAQEALEGVNAEIRNAYLEMLDIEQKIADALVELKDAQDALAGAQREAEAVANRLEAAHGELERINSDIADGQTRIANARDSLGVVARAQYRGDTTPSAMELLVGSSSVSDFLDSYATAEAITRTQTTSLAEVEQATARNETRAVRQADVGAQIAELKEQADRLVAERTGKEAAAQAKKDMLEGLQRSLEARTSEFQAYGASLQSQIAEAGDEREKMIARIAAIDEANRAAAEARARMAQERAANVQGGNGFIAPVVPGATIVSEFGWRIHPIYGTPRLHEGIDFAVGCGVPQQAPGDGTVAGVVYNNPGGGNYIVFDLGEAGGHHWEVRTLHLMSGTIAVSPGQKVVRGQIVGLTGMTGAATGCHVHQEVRMDGRAINPRLVL